MQRTQNYNLVKIDLTDSPPDITVLNPNFDTIDQNLFNKVDKAEGKQLSTNDFTTEEKNKLAGIADGANNYTHPPTHSANEITEEVDKRFFTDAERSKLTAIQDGANNYVHPESHPAAIITEDETHRFFTDAERNKLTAIQEGANNYVHPESHPATIITEDETHRFFTDVERNKLNGITEGANNYVHPPTHTASEITEEVDKRFFTDGERAKLSGIQDGANNYVHPEKHPANIIEEEANRRFFTDGERAKLSGIQDGANNYTHPTSHTADMILFNGNQSLQNFIDAGGTFGGIMVFNQNIDVKGGTHTPRILGANENVYFGNSDKGTRIDVTGGIFRLFTTFLGVGVDNGILVGLDGSLSVKCNSVNTHVFHANGQKTGGSMEIDGTVYGMSPTDSPQTLIEYLEYDINVEGEKVINLDPIYKKMISKYAVFSSNPDIKIVEKTSDYFKVKGSGMADFVIKGQRKGADEYFRIMGGLEHGVTEEQTI